MGTIESNAKEKADRRQLICKVVKLTICAVLFTICFCLAGKILGTRYGIYADGRISKCLPYTVFIIDKWHKKGEVGDYFAFHAQNTRMFKNGSVLAKQFVAGLGDAVEITNDEEVLINGIKSQQGLHLANKMGQPKENFMGKTIIEKDEFFALGSTEASFDSRYWGTVNENQIIGRLYPVF